MKKIVATLVLFALVFSACLAARMVVVEILIPAASTDVALMQFNDNPGPAGTVRAIERTKDIVDGFTALLMASVALAGVVIFYRKAAPQTKKEKK